MVGGDTLKIIKMTEGVSVPGANMDAQVAPEQVSYYNPSDGKLRFTLSAVKAYFPFSIWATLTPIF